MRISDWSSDVCSSDLVDLRGRNSWRLQMDEVPSVELLETQLVNAVAPFIINARLKPLLLRTPGGEAPTRDKHIVNVSAVEVQFYRNRSEERCVGKEWFRTGRSGWWPSH